MRSGRRISSLSLLSLAAVGTWIHEVAFIPPQGLRLSASSLRQTEPKTRMLFWPWDTSSATNEDDVAAYEVWAAEYQKAAAAGEFLGSAATREKVVAQAATLRGVLGLGPGEVVELAKQDSMVLFAAVNAATLQETFTQLQEEVGSREEALQVVKLQPGCLLAGVREIKGKGKLLANFAQVSAALRPVYRASRSVFAPIATNDLFPKAPNFDQLVGTDQNVDLRETGRSILRFFSPIFGPAILPFFFALSYASSYLYGHGGEDPADTAAAAAAVAKPLCLFKGVCVPRPIELAKSALSSVTSSLGL